MGLASSVRSLPNEYAQDDRPIIERNGEVHSLRNPTGFFTRSYWPKPYAPALFRPLASLSYAVQWTIGGGSPRVFRIGSIGLLILSGLAFYRLAGQVLGAGPGWIAAAFFMVHPAHVEATAVGVNQSELVVGLLAALLVSSFVTARKKGNSAPTPIGRMLGLFVLALMFKESAAVLIGLVVAAELLLTGDETPWPRRLITHRPLILAMILVVVAFGAIRSLALGGNVLGTFVAEGIDGQSMGGRALTMLGVVPHWFRLLLWPAHLRGDYSPQEISTAATFGLDQAFGTALVIAAIGLVGTLWKRAPAVSFGLVWTGIAIFPVSNVLVPTGVVLAERTLFLASMGMMLAVGGLIAPLFDWLGRQSASWSLLGASLVAAILALGTSRSDHRQRVWRTNDTFWQQTVIDAPRSYRARHASAQILFSAGKKREGELEFRTAIELYPRAWGLYFEQANRLREAGRCADAVIFYQRTLLVNPATGAARAGMIACLVYDARYAEAADAARDGVRVAGSPGQARLYGRFLAIADSARKIGAPPKTVTLTVETRDTLP